MMSHSECQMLFEAGRTLVEKSGLAYYCGKHFIALNDRDRFEKYWEDEFHPKFGRYMAWVLFSVGAENLAKAACVCNKVVKAKHRPTMENYVEKHLNGLFDGDDDRALVKGYERLTMVRNRDAHSYRKNKRDAEFPLVEEQFVPAFNILVKAMRNADHQLPESI